MADFDGDGRTDLLSGSPCCQGYCFYVYCRQEDGSFGERETLRLKFSEDEYNFFEYDLAGKGLVSRVAVGDWSGDGVPDVVIGNFGSGDIGVVYGPLDREGELPVRRFRPRGRMPFTARIGQPVLADWDGDGLLDLVFTGSDGADKSRNDGNGVYWSRNIGTASQPALAAPQLLIADMEGWITNGVCVADWNGDGRLDLIATRTTSDQSRPGTRVTLHNKVWVYLRQGR